ncbi:hypothetical protein SCUCBS95973_002700 [Sporothrix curviconia]|uniref:Beta-catenin-like protein 1 N-terminal domain-containing protein n=1 Tax=Sporothrix curviconia TaxID=1260050 RepID=A0ABP0B9B9_9PEZI
MTSIDELFKKSGVPSKRKFEPVRDPNEIYKSAKLTSSNGGGSSRHARVEDDNDDDIEAGPSLPPDGADEDGEGDYGPAPPPDDEEEEGDDDEGRFFGGGITKAEASILDYVEGQDGPGGGGTKKKVKEDDTPEEFDAAWLRKTALNLEKRINRNAELRARYESEPTKFIASEADLDADIKALSILGEHPELYPEFARLGSVTSLVSLLAHDNTDIAISAIEILGELTDEDVDATDEQWVALVDALLEADLVGLLVSNLARLNEDPAEDPDGVDRTGVYNALGIVENLCSLRATRATDALGHHTPLLRWLLQRIQKKDKEELVSQNKQYAAEILVALVYRSPANREGLIDLDAVDILLQLVATYRRRDPERGGNEEEYMADLFEALTYLVSDASDASDASESPDATTSTVSELSKGKAKFIEAEGVELCLLMLKEGNKSRTPALKLLDHATSGMFAGAVCMKLVKAGGLKPTFTMFMRGGGDDDASAGKKKPKKSKGKGADGQGLHAGPTAEHLLAIFYTMLRLLPADSPERIRLLAKFVEKNYEKVDQLMALRSEYAQRIAAVDRALAVPGREPTYAIEPDMTEEERQDLADTERLSLRLDAGLYTLQTLDIILAWLIVEDGGAQNKIRSLLAANEGTSNGSKDASAFAVLRVSLQERRDELDPRTAEGKEVHDMLTALLEFL